MMSFWKRALNGRQPERNESGFRLREIYSAEDLPRFDDSLARLQFESVAEEWPGSALPALEVFRRRIALARRFGIQGELGSAYADGLGHGRVRVRQETPPFTCLAFGQDGEPVGIGALAPGRSQSGEAAVRLWVRPAVRGSGVGRALFRRVATYAAHKGMQSLFGRSCSLAPVGERFARALGGSLRSRIRFVEVQVRNCPLRQPTCRPSTVSIELSKATYPIEVRPEVAQLKQAVSIRYGNAGANVSAESFAAGMKRWRQVLDAMGIEAWTLEALDQSGRCVGYSEYLWDPEQPAILKHQDLAVARNRRDGSVAAHLMLARGRVLQEKPSVTAVRFARLCRVQEPEVDAQDASGGHHFESRWRFRTDEVVARLSAG